MLVNIADFLSDIDRKMDNSAFVRQVIAAGNVCQDPAR